MSDARALFQLGMDLDPGSSTAQKEREAAPPEAHAAAGGRKDFFIERDGVRCAGTHLIVDLMGAHRLDDLAYIDQTLRRCADAAGATLLQLHLHHFTPNNGVSGVAVLAESHISVHTWPERGYAALDVFMCGDTQPMKAVEIMREAFRPERLAVSEHLRGTDL